MNAISRALLLVALCVLLPCCAQSFAPLHASEDALLTLPLLDAADLVADGAWRVEVEVEVHAVQIALTAAHEVLLLLLRSDADGFRFEAMNELGLPVLAWPPHRGLAPASVDPAIVARLMQLALADAQLWSRTLAQTRWQIVVDANGGRTLLRHGARAPEGTRTYVTIVAANAGQTLVYCARGMLANETCVGTQWQLQVQALPPGTSTP